MAQINGWDESSLNLELYFCTEVLKLNSLHYGYWEEPEKIDLESIGRAQERYTQTMIGLVPEGVDTILDVGCGVGDVALALARRGYRVTAISPDRNHVESVSRLAERMDPGRILFHNVKFEDFNVPDKYDLILMSESQDYFDMDIGFAQCRKYLCPGGFLLVSGNFRKGKGETFVNSFLESVYTECAGTYGLELKRRIDITRNVLPTLEFANEALHRYAMPGWKVLNHYFGAPAQFKLKLLRLLFGREFRRLMKLQRYYESYLNPALYLANVEYVRLLFRNEAASSAARPE